MSVEQQVDDLLHGEEAARAAGMSNDDIEAAWAKLGSTGQMAHYYRCRAKGTGHNLSVIFASGEAPLMDRTDERLRRPNEEAQVRGLKGGSYHPGLAQFPNDPRAVVQSRGDARRNFSKTGEKIGSTMPEHNTGTSSNQYKRAKGV